MVKGRGGGEDTVLDTDEGFSGFKEEGDAGTPVRSTGGWVLIATGLHEETAEEDLQDHFSEYGEIRNLHMNLDRRTGHVKGYAFLEYKEKSEAEETLAKLDGKTFLGQPLRVGWAFVNPTGK